MEKNIILTGGTGFIGSQLAEKILNENKNIVLLKRSHSNIWRIENLIDSFDNLETINIDKVKISEIFETFNIEGILHLATHYSKFHNSDEIKDMIYSNVTFPTILLENSIKNNLKYFVNTGSYGEYLGGDYSGDKILFTENSKIIPFNLYSSTKVAFENILKFYNQEYGIKTASLKLFTPYGPKDDENKIIPYLIVNYIKKNKITINSASKKLDVLFVSDIIDAYEKLIQNIKKFKMNENFNIASGTSHSIKNIYSMVDSMLGDTDGGTDIEFLESDPSDVKVDISKAYNLLNWKPKIDLNQGLKLTIDYYKNKYKTFI